MNGTDLINPTICCGGSQNFEEYFEVYISDDLYKCAGHLDLGLVRGVGQY